jgi:hypothetical protein
MIVLWLNSLVTDPLSPFSRPTPRQSASCALDSLFNVLSFSLRLSGMPSSSGILLAEVLSPSRPPFETLYVLVYYCLQYND